MSYVFPFLGKDSAQVSHPPHLTSSWSSALIPFCSYKTDMNFSKESPGLDGTNIPLCSSFLPTILEGQLCYKLMLNKTSKQGKKNQLMLLLDYNEERALQELSNKTVDFDSSNAEVNYDTTAKIAQGLPAKVQINTLSPYINFGGGIFIMSVVKRMTAKKDFLTMELKDRNCEVELHDDCRTKKLLEECGCVPWEASGVKVTNQGGRSLQKVKMATKLSSGAYLLFSRQIRRLLHVIANVNSIQYNMQYIPYNCALLAQ